MRRVRLWLLLALAPSLLGAGCTAIRSEQPLGEEIAVLDPQRMDGLWLGRAGELVGVRVLDAEQGKLVFWTARDAGQPDAPVLCEPPAQALRSCSAEPSPCVWRRHAVPAGGDFYFRSVPGEAAEERKPKEEYFATVEAVRSDGRSFAIRYGFGAQDQLDRRLKELILRGVLPERIDPEGKVILGPLLAAHLRLLLLPEAGVVDWASGVPFVKLPPDFDPCVMRGSTL